MLIGHSSSIASSPGQFSGEMPDAVLRPRFQSLEQRAGKFVERGKPKLGKRVFAGGDDVVIEVDQVDDAKVDLADRIGVVVEQGDHALLVTARQVEFFLDLTLDRRLVSARTGFAGTGVDGIHVAADTDGNLRVQPVFAAGFAAGVVKDAVAVSEHAIGDELLVGRILLGFGAVHEEMVRGVEQTFHRRFDPFGPDAVKISDFLKQRARHHQHLLTGVFRHAGRVAERGRRGEEKIGGIGGDAKGKAGLPNRFRTSRFDSV
jgi:hypothetical protein